MKLIKTLGSLSFAVFLISGLTGILIVSTYLESLHGTPFAKRHFYEARWFDVFLGLVWVNIFCATLTRWPFKKRHVGFIITHIGILTLLIGTLITRLTGAEGQMTLLEGEQWNRLQQTGSDILVSPQEGSGYQFRLPQNASDKPHRLKVPDSELKLFFHELSDNAGSRLNVTNDNEFYNPAVQFTLASERVGVRRQEWLILRDPENPFADELELGPARFRLEDADEAAETAAAGPELHVHPARLVLYRKSGVPIDSVELPLAAGSSDPLPIADGEFTLSNVRFLTHARVADNRLVDEPASGKWNPAVEFTVADRKGAKEHHTRFALFPDFDSLHGKDTPNIFDLRVELRAEEPHSAAEHDASQPELVFEVRDKGEWTWKSKKSDGTGKSGTVQKGATFETGWMDMKITVDQILPHAAVSRTTGPLPTGSDEGETGSRVTYVDANGKTQEAWVLVSRPLPIQTSSGRWTLNLTDRSLELPFTLQLRDFRKIDYPGTSNPASFESDVTLFDAAKGVKIERTIKMNEPLDYAGWRIFQSSYIQDPQFGEASVFTIAKNPGIGLTYAGSLILLAGVITLFYIRPFSSGDHVH